ncbi:MAG: PKD domain-containing protein [Candidatus Micrarchaeota archaeon]
MRNWLFVLLISIVLLFGCASAPEQPAPATGQQQAKPAEPAPQEKAQTLEQFFEQNGLNKEFDFGELKTSDSNGDGKKDNYKYEFAREELQENLFLERKIEYARENGDSFKGAIVLSFENTGGSQLEYTHIENIPKEFAASVDDITFSIPPTRIIEADPVVEHKIDLLKNIDLVMYGVKEQNESFVMDQVLLFAVTYNNEQCKKLKGDEATLCSLKLLSEYPEFGEKGCQRLQDTKSPEANLCWAAFKKDNSYCEKITDGDKKKTCKLFVFKLIREDCLLLKGEEQQNECVLAAALKGGFFQTCNHFENLDWRNLCYSQLIGDISYCKGIASEQLRTRCCNAVPGENERNACMGNEQKEEKEQEKQTGSASITGPEDIMALGVYYNFTAEYSGAPTKAVYVWDFGELNGERRTSSTIQRYEYWKEGEYTVKVSVYDSTGKELLAQGEKKFQAKRPFDLLDILQMTEDISVSIRAQSTVKDTKDQTHEQLFIAIFNTREAENPIVWDGRKFSATFDMKKTSSMSGEYLKLEGEVSEDAKTLLSFSGYLEYNQKNNERRIYKLSIKNVPIELSTKMPDRIDPGFNPKFTGFVLGPNAESYFVSYESEHYIPSTSDPNFKVWTESVSWQESAKPFVEVIFKKGGIVAYDQPSYGK